MHICVMTIHRISLLPLDSCIHDCDNFISITEYWILSQRIHNESFCSSFLEHPIGIWKVMGSNPVKDSDLDIENNVVNQYGE